MSMVLIVRKREEKHVVVQCHHFWGGQTTHGTPSAMILETPRSHEMVWCSFEHMDATLYKMSFFKDFWSPKTKTWGGRRELFENSQRLYERDVEILSHILIIFRQRREEHIRWCWQVLEKRKKQRALSKVAVSF
jgi:hypothetical protein